MWFNSVYLKTLRDFRVAILGWGLGFGLLIYAVLSTVPSLVSTPQAKASLISLAGSFTWLAEPIAIITPGGYATWKYGFTILLIAIWPLMACSRMLRGDEERGTLDVLLAVPHGRVRLALEKLAAVWTALLGMGLLIALLTFAGSNGSFSMADALLFSLNIILTCGIFGSIALLLSQFTQDRGTASGITGGLLGLFIVLDMVHRVIPNTEWISRISPVYYYNASKPLIPSYGTNVGAMLLILALNIILSGVAIWLFALRDIGRTVALVGRSNQPVRAARLDVRPANAWSLRSIYTRSLGMIIVPTFWWTLVIAGFAGWMVVVVKQTEAQLSSLISGSSVLSGIISKVGGGDINTNATILSAFFTFLPLLLMAFAVTQSNRWSSDEEDGRLELVLSTPQPRLQVMLGRFAALTTATIIIGVLTLAVTVLASVTSGLKLDEGNVVAATLSMIPLGLLVAAIGYLFSGWLRTALDTGLLSFLLVIWFFISFVGPELNWSDATLRLSAFYYYGTPLLHGLPLADTLGVLIVAIILLALASLRFMRKDIAH